MFREIDYAIHGPAAFDLIDNLGKHDNPDSILDALAGVLLPLGYSRFSVFDLVRADQALNDRVWAYRASQAWLKIYLENNYVHHDAALRAARSAKEPFRYGDAPFNADEEPRTAMIMEQAREFDITNGILVPVQNGAVCRGCFWFGGENVDPSPRLWPLLHFIGLYSYHRIRSLVAPSRKSAPHLTPREREVLTWIANGKSAWEIGEILGISMRTVNEHAQSVGNKLGAANRTQAVALALRDHLIAL